MPTLLAILAHPDDESFGPGGTLAKYVHEGVDVHVCIATDGGAGECDPALLAASGYDDLAQLRLQELNCACEVLGVSLHLLHFGDSGMAANGDPHCLARADLDDVAHRIADLILSLRPNVVITHGPTGDYFHPDHIKVHQGVMRALEFDSVRGIAGLRVYYSAIPYSQVKWFIRILRLLRKDPTSFGENGDVDITRVGTPNDEISVRLNVGDFFAVKQRASACHHSQGGGGFNSRWIPEFIQRRFSRYDYFVQVYPPGAGRHAGLFSA